MDLTNNTEFEQKLENVSNEISKIEKSVVMTDKRMQLIEKNISRFVKNQVDIRKQLVKSNNFNKQINKKLSYNYKQLLSSQRIEKLLNKGFIDLRKYSSKIVRRLDKNIEIIKENGRLLAKVNFMQGVIDNSTKTEQSSSTIGKKTKYSSAKERNEDIQNIMERIVPVLKDNALQFRENTEVLNKDISKIVLLATSGKLKSLSGDFTGEDVENVLSDPNKRASLDTLNKVLISLQDFISKNSKLSDLVSTEIKTFKPKLTTDYQTEVVKQLGGINDKLNLMLGKTKSGATKQDTESKFKPEEPKEEKGFSLRQFSNQYLSKSTISKFADDPFAVSAKFGYDKLLGAADKKGWLKMLGIGGAGGAGGAGMTKLAASGKGLAGRAGIVAILAAAAYGFVDQTFKNFKMTDDEFKDHVKWYGDKYDFSKGGVNVAKSWAEMALKFLWFPNWGRWISDFMMEFENLRKDVINASGNMLKAEYNKRKNIFSKNVTKAKEFKDYSLGILSETTELTKNDFKKLYNRVVPVINEFAVFEKLKLDENRFDDVKGRKSIRRSVQESVPNQDYEMKQLIRELINSNNRGQQPIIIPPSTMGGPNTPLTRQTGKPTM